MKLKYSNTTLMMTVGQMFGYYIITAVVTLNKIMNKNLNIHY